MQGREEHSCQKIEYILLWQVFGKETQEYKKCDGYKLLFMGCLACYPHCKHQQIPNEKGNNLILKLYLSCLSAYIFIALLLLQNTSSVCFWLPEYPLITGKYSLACNWDALCPEKLEDFLKCMTCRRTEAMDLYSQLLLPWSLDSCRRGLLLLGSPLSLSLEE